MIEPLCVKQHLESLGLGLPLTLFIIDLSLNIRRSQKNLRNKRFRAYEHHKEYDSFSVSYQ
jgi:hypothetical protein